MSWDYLVKFTFNRNIEKILDEKQKDIKRRLVQKLKESAEYVKYKMAEYAPYKTGNLAQTILSLPVTQTKGFGINILVEKGKIEFALHFRRRKDNIIKWVNYGTGIYGPHGQPIRPRRKRFMVFMTEDGNFIKTDEVKGQKGKHFIRKAVGASKLIMITKIRSALRSR